MDLQVFGPRLVYRLSFRTARAKHRNSVLKNPKIESNKNLKIMLTRALLSVLGAGICDTPPLASQLVVTPETCHHALQSKIISMQLLGRGGGRN